MIHSLKNIFKFSYTLRSPIDLQLLKTKQGQHFLKQNVQKRFKPESLVPSLIQNYQIFRKDLYQFEQHSKLSNDKKKQLKIAIQNKNQNIQILKQQLSKLKQKLLQQQLRLKQSISSTNQLLSEIGNSVHSTTVISKNQNNNKILRYYHPLTGIVDVDQNFNHQQFQQKYLKIQKQTKSYQDITKEFNIADLPRGQKVSGHRGYFLCKNGVKFALSLAQYGLNFLQQKGYQIYQTPALILQQVLRESCQLQTIQSDMYRFKQDNLCLIATSQQTLAGYYRGEVLEQKHFPLRMGGYSSCFRRQAGAHGKDIHGLFRLHQFEKVQQFNICNPQKSQEEMKFMINNSQLFYQSLKIPYRVIDIVSGQLNDAAIKKIDIQAWFPAQKKFRELVSVSNCTDYQSRLLQTKFREGKGTKYPHMLNGTLVAIQRTMTCLLQHFYNKQSDSLIIPQCFQPFIRTKQMKKK